MKEPAQKHLFALAQFCGVAVGNRDKGDIFIAPNDKLADELIEAKLARVATKQEVAGESAADAPAAGGRASSTSGAAASA